MVAQPVDINIIVLYVSLVLATNSIQPIINNLLRQPQLYPVANIRQLSTKSQIGFNVGQHIVNLYPPGLVRSMNRLTQAAQKALIGGIITRTTNRLRQACQPGQVCQTNSEVANSVADNIWWTILEHYFEITSYCSTNTGGHILNTGPTIAWLDLDLSKLTVRGSGFVSYLLYRLGWLDANNYDPARSTLYSQLTGLPLVLSSIIDSYAYELTEQIAIHQLIVNPAGAASCGVSLTLRCG